MGPLADTPVWIHHYRSPNLELMKLIKSGQIHMHPAIIGELAVGNLHARATTIAKWQSWPQAPSIAPKGVLRFIEQFKRPELG